MRFAARRSFPVASPSAFTKVRAQQEMAFFLKRLKGQKKKRKYLDPAFDLEL